MRQLKDVIKNIKYKTRYGDWWYLHLNPYGFLYHWDKDTNTMTAKDHDGNLVWSIKELGLGDFEITKGLQDWKCLTEKFLIDSIQEKGEFLALTELNNHHKKFEDLSGWKQYKREEAYRLMGWTERDHFTFTAPDGSISHSFLDSGPDIFKINRTIMKDPNWKVDWLRQNAMGDVYHWEG